MNTLRNEKGAALVLTIMIITLFLVFILGLFTVVTNTTKQVTTMEKQIDAQLIAEMGVTYFQRVVEKSKPELQEKIQNNPEEVDRIIETHTTTLIDSLDNPVTIDGDRRTFEITFEDYNEEERRISFHSIGTANNVKATANGTIVITISE
ncbi:hypothetical protein [Oceanobacillus saliphilus]|uniref:hypothetical protein n=1 Tax=Oceanobacillus saliphilus TaxID=2925834 RepID=UPI00201E5662|nr:hypothetical protein [Oceanobacillus saliphilus]